MKPTITPRLLALAGIARGRFARLAHYGRISAINRVRDRYTLVSACTSSTNCSCRRYRASDALYRTDRPIRNLIASSQIIDSAPDPIVAIEDTSTF